MNYLAGIALTGVGATALIDLWALARRSLFAVPLPNYTLVGRWIGHWSHGQFRHESIATATAIRGERALGWIAHYLLGIAFACLLPLTIGFGWLDDPTLIPALLVGVGTVTAPFLVMQPAMGAGFAASRSPRPGAARLQSLVTHTTFGLCLFLSGLVVTQLLNGE